MQHQPSGRAQTVEILSRAIAEWRIVRATYNGEKMHLAPYQLFVRHDALFVSAFNPGKNWRGPEDYRLSYFNISGLSDVTLKDAGFRPVTEIKSDLPRPEDQMLMELEAA